MAGGGSDLQSPKKRKREHAEGKTKPRPQVKGGGDGAKRKKHAGAGGYAAHGGAGEAVAKKKQPVTPREKRLAAKEMSEARKMKRKRHYSLEKELTKLWEKMRCHDVSKEERSKHLSRLVSQAIRKMDGKYLDIAGSHVTARVLQTCVKWCSQPERDAIFVDLQPHLLTLSRKKYAVFLVKKLIELATKKQFAGFISSLHGHIAKLLPHTIGAAVVDYAFQRATQPQKRQMLLELYSTELQLFKDLTVQSSCSLLETISKLGLQKSSVLQYMTIVLQKILEKGTVEYSIVHTAILEYFTIADKTSALDVIRQLIPLLTQGASIIDGDEPSIAPELPKKTKAKKKRLSEPLIVRIMQTREGLKLAISCLKHGSAKDRKKIIKSLKGHIMKLALNDFGCLFLINIISIVDDTKLVSKIVIQELAKHLKQLIFDKNGRRPLLQLLHPLCSRYLPPADLAFQGEASESGTEVISEKKVDAVTDKESDGLEGMPIVSESKKDPSQRRHELLIKSELAEALVQSCIENVGELLRTNLGKDLLYEVAVGGKDNVLEGAIDRIQMLHDAIASDAAQPKTEDIEHAFENYFSSRVIRKMIIDCPAFAVTLWRKALKGKCKIWAEGHSSKVVAAFLESPSSEVRDLAKPELQPLVDTGVLKVPDHKAVEK
ncbi:Pumilio-like protein 24 [Dichanthelium oligosanthes]|uniref:Pumilio-like protein 24 n=1 Tax=Dichanthelium oligosanthes TaxID=888268 RepID=A0A1E5US86_9POAL|nr:Pumilio-like protein 24 [Dichanthelium oligosanthes]